MATPLVAGCAAVTREHLIRGGLPRPSAALVKAILINGARDIRGQYTPSEADSVPNHSEGFGRVDLSSSVGPYQAGESVRYWDENLELETGDEEHHDIHVTQHGTALKITLVWTDPPGDSLQNDLDLVALASTGEERRGNTQPGVAAFDRVNNVEQILWEDVPIGVVRVTVRAHRTTVFAQPYALVARTRS
jgi:hypothetical protein